MAAVDLRASKTGYLTLDQAAIGGENPTRQLLTKGLKVTLNSDDPAYFFGHTDKYGKTHGGYVDSCYHATARECGLTADECVLLARNSLEATFATPEEKAALVERLRAYCEGFSA